MKDKLKKLFAKTRPNERRPAQFSRQFLEYAPGIGKDALLRLDEVFPKKVQLTKAKKANFMVDIAWSSSVLEGNLYSHLDTQKLLQYGVAAEHASAEDTQMIINHKRAFDLVIQSKDVSLRMLKAIHVCIADPGEIQGPTKHFVLKHELGQIRTTELMDIDNTAYTPPSYYPGTGQEKIYDLIDYVMNAASEIENPIEAAFYLMTRVPYVQAFADCNKRTSRMMANVPLLAHGCMPISFDIMKKRDYIEALLGVYEFGNVEIFRDVFLGSYVDSFLKYYPLPRSIENEVRLNMPAYQEKLALYVCTGQRSELIDNLIFHTKTSTPDAGYEP
ncbi:Fic family protein [Pseudomonas serbica]|uniref:Fic family protein n=1 Tax=Pseudomonas serbica TaxID=2965074 RepID=UPI00237C41D2|nr:Fic family protein [Pseudomonas serbica]